MRLTHGVRKAFGKVPLLKGVPYDHAMKKLGRASMVRDGKGDWLIRRITETDREILTDLGLMPHITGIKNSRGRPRKAAKARVF